MYDESIEYYDRCLKVDPNMEDAIWKLGMIYYN